MTNMGIRVHYIDVAKGLLISLVVIGHCAATSLGDHSRLFYFIYAFHMPCWFFISGILYKTKNPEQYFSAKVKTLLLPYLICSLLNMLLSGAAHVCNKDDILLFRFGGLWFLITLFFICIIYFVLDNACFKAFSEKTKLFLLSIVAIMLVAVGMVLGKDKQGAHDTVIATMVNFFFFHLGVCAKPISAKLNTEKLGVRIVFCVIGFILLAVLGYIAPLNPSPIDVNINRFGNKIMFLSFAVLGSLGMMIFSAGIQKARFIEYLGRNSLVILVFHIPLWRVVNRVCIHFDIVGYPKLFLTSLPAFLGALAAVEIVNNHFPGLKGDFKYIDTIK